MNWEILPGNLRRAGAKYYVSGYSEGRLGNWLFTVVKAFFGRLGNWEIDRNWEIAPSNVSFLFYDVSTQFPNFPIANGSIYHIRHPKFQNQL